MTAAKNIRKGDWIKDGRHNGQVTRVTEPEIGYLLIEWEHGGSSGVMGRAARKDVRRVHKPKNRGWLW